MNRKPLKRALVFGQRWRLNNPEPWTGLANVSCKNEILALFPEVELIYDHINNRVDLYRVIGKGHHRMYDTLVHEFKLKAPPGPWLIEHMAKHDTYLTLGKFGDRFKEFTKQDDSYLASQKDKEESNTQNMLDYLDKNAQQLGKKRVTLALSNRPRLRNLI